MTVLKTLTKWAWMSNNINSNQGNDTIGNIYWACSISQNQNLFRPFKICLNLAKRFGYQCVYSIAQWLGLRGSRSSFSRSRSDKSRFDFLMEWSLFLASLQNDILLSFLSQVQKADQYTSPFFLGCLKSC